MPTITRNCDCCGNEYTRRRVSEAGKYCSRVCYGRANRKHASATCASCGAEFAHKSWLTPKFCSPSCAADSYRNKVTRACDQCGKAYTRVPTAIGKYCSTECRSAGVRKANPSVRRMRFAPGHPLTLKAPYVPEHRAVLFEKLGPGSHPCHYCGETVTWVPGGRTGKGVLVVDHMDRNPMNNTPGNLVPACCRCNILNSARVVEDKEDFRTVGARKTRLRGLPRNCESCGAAFVTWTMNPGEGKGRFCSRSCARRKPKAGGSDQL